MSDRVIIKYDNVRVCDNCGMEISTRYDDGKPPQFLPVDSIYGNDGIRISYSMQVIKDGHTLDHICEQCASKMLQSTFKRLFKLYPCEEN